MPQNNAALYVKSRAYPLEVKEFAYPAVGKGEIVVKNAAVAINPVDYMIQGGWDIFPTYPAIFGEDAAGEVVEVGEGVTSFSVGDRVIVHALGLMTHEAKHNTFQEYMVAKAEVTSRIPSGLKYEQAVVLPLAISTAAHGLYGKNLLGLPFPSLKPKDQGKVVLVWGGSSSVGSCTIQLARASGFEVFATASKKNHEYCKSLGASQVFDYNSSTVVKDIIAALVGKKLAGVYDAISKEQCVNDNVEILNKTDSVKNLALVLPTAKTDFPGINAVHVYATAIANDEVGVAVWQDYIPKALESGQFQAKPDAKIVGKGLESIQTAIDIMKNGVSATKLVVTLE